MPDDEDWLMRPNVEGKCDYAHYVNGTLNLEDIARMNDALDVRMENERRYREATK